MHAYGFLLTALSALACGAAAAADLPPPDDAYDLLSVVVPPSSSDPSSVRGRGSIGVEVEVEVVPPSPSPPPPIEESSAKMMTTTTTMTTPPAVLPSPLLEDSRRKFADLITGTIRDAVRNGRVQRGLPPVETSEERRRRRERRRSAEAFGGEGGGGGVALRGEGRGRRTTEAQDTIAVEDSFIVSFLSDENGTALCAGIDPNIMGPDGFDVGLAKTNLVMLNFSDVVANSVDLCNPDSEEELLECFRFQRNAFWSIDLINGETGLNPTTNKYRTDGPNAYRAWLSGQGGFMGVFHTVNYYMEVKKYRKNKKARINQADPYNPLQTFDFRGGHRSLFDTDALKLTRWTDHTWRSAMMADPTGNAIPSKNLCFEPDTGGRDHPSLGDPVRLTRCSTSDGLKRLKQTWGFCGKKRSCETKLDVPDFDITVRCEDQDEDDIEAESCSRERDICSCTDNNGAFNVQDEYDAPSGTFDDAGCDESLDNDKTSTPETTYKQVTIDDEDEDRVDIQMTGCNTANAGIETLIRVYKRDGNNWKCIDDRVLKCRSEEQFIVDNDGSKELLIKATGNTKFKSNQCESSSLDCY